MAPGEHKKKGLKMMLYGWLLATTGITFTHYQGYPVLLIFGMALCVAGGSLFLAGWALFMFVAVGNFLNGFRRLKTDPKKLYRLPKQPWEK